MILEYKEEGIPFIRGINMKNGRINFSDMTYIDEKANSILWKSEVKPNTALLSMSGTIGDVALASENWDYPINSNQDIAKICTNGQFNPYLFFAFLLGRFGQNYLKREARRSVQQHVFLSQIELFEIPLFSNKFEEKTESVIRQSNSLLETSEESYTQAETLLLETLGLEDFQPTQEAVNVKSFSQSFGSSGRLDTEYYQPKYEAYLSEVMNYEEDYDFFKEVCNIEDSNFIPQDKIMYKYVERSNIGVPGDIMDCTKAKGKDLPTRARRIIAKNDVIISSIEDSLSSWALVTEEYNEALCSTGFYVINSSKINSETLLILFKSQFMQMLLKKGCSGTILTAINKDELQQIPIPLIRDEIQQQIATLVQKSFHLKPSPRNS